MNEKLIKELREGRCAVRNDGTLEDLKQILKAAFPNCSEPKTVEGNYYLLNKESLCWQYRYTEKQGLKIYSVKDFFTTNKYTIEEINNKKDILIIIKSEKEFNKLKSLGINLSKKYCGHYYHKPCNGATFHDDLDFNELPWSNYIVLNYSDIIMQEKTEFKKGDYIVTLKVGIKIITGCGKNNYCFKQRIDSDSIAPEIDLNGSTINENEFLSFDRKKALEEWRYATQEEIDHYNKIGKPYDVTTIPNPFPRIMLVSDTNDIKTADERVVFMFKCGQYITWYNAKTIEEAEKEYKTKGWIYAWELDELKSIFPFSLSSKDAQSIIDIACNLWKVKLAEKWAVNIVKKESITIPVEEYNEMYSACTDDQKELFNKIFN